ncbi:hypothetical protein [Aquimarina sp. 2201CG5-10]|uniref:hypothetical protein n=1 Tax=Aquimarina callyspongiae TaxID=3098150 RepID=UPI002AB5BC90|nr:hypothetical protein [Aquimarina sp. 2201CG5-10]MDY8134791.1 hypothetical protein [Aquimarina sp. 2201CG5-10]
MKKITQILTFLLLCSCFNQGFAIDVSEPIEKLLKDYVNRMNALNQGTDKEDVLILFDEKYRGNTVYVNLSGALVRKNYEKKDISSQLDDIMNDDNYDFKLKLDKVVFKTQKETAGTISAVISFESFINKKLAEKGTMLMDIVGIRSNGGWKIVQNNMIRVSEEKDIGECVCYVYAKGSTKFVTEVYFPSGLEYSQEFDSFLITTKDEKRIIKSNNKEFYWNRGDGKLTFKGGALGKADNARNAVEFVLKDLYRDSCAKIVFN